MKNRTCSLEVSKRLRELGYDEITEDLYCTDFRHNGRHISFEEELDLRAEGKESEIETVPFGDLIHLMNKNSDNDEDTCSAPAIYDAIDWLRETFSVVIYNEPFYASMEQRTLYTPRIMSLNIRLFQKYVDTNSLNGIAEYDYWGALDKALLKATDVLIEKKRNNALE